MPGVLVSCDVIFPRTLEVLKSDDLIRIEAPYPHVVRLEPDMPPMLLWEVERPSRSFIRTELEIRLRSRCEYYPADWRKQTDADR